MKVAIVFSVIILLARCCLRPCILRSSTRTRSTASPTFALPSALTPTTEPSPALQPQNPVSADGDCTLRGRAVSCKAFREQVTIVPVDDLRGLDCNSMANQPALRIDGSATAEVTGRVGDCCRFSGLGWVFVADRCIGGFAKKAPVPGHPPLTSCEVEMLNKHILGGPIIGEETNDILDCSGWEPPYGQGAGLPRERFCRNLLRS